MTPSEKEAAETQRTTASKPVTLSDLYALYDQDVNCGCTGKRLGRLAGGLVRCLGTEFSMDLSDALGYDTYDVFVSEVRSNPRLVARKVLGLRAI